MANNKRGKAAFFDDSAFNIEQQETQVVQEVQEKATQQVQEVQEDNTTSTISFGATQGRKGHKSPRINMAFSPENHAWIKTRSRQLGVSATEFVNTILDNERMKG